MPLPTKNELIRENNELRTLLAQLVTNCTPLRLPTDTEFYGAMAPDKALLEKSRDHLAKT